MLEVWSELCCNTCCNVTCGQMSYCRLACLHTVWNPCVSWNQTRREQYLSSLAIGSLRVSGWDHERITAGKATSCGDIPHADSEVAPEKPTAACRSPEKQLYVAPLSSVKGCIFCKWEETMSENIRVRHTSEERVSLCRRSYAFLAFVFPCWMSWTFWIFF